MKRLTQMATAMCVAVSFTAMLPTLASAQCCDDQIESPHFFSNPCPSSSQPGYACTSQACNGHNGRPCWRCRLKIGWRLTGLQSQLTAGDMPIHTPYQTWQTYYYFRPYQARQSDYNSGFEATIREALGVIYEQRKQRIRQTVAEVDPLEYSILPGQEY